MATPVAVSLVSWENASTDLLAVRRAVFVLEQGVPEEREVDEHDPVSSHFLAHDSTGRAIGTARLLLSGRAGRVAVLPEWRRSGVGRALMLAIHAAARDRGDLRLTLHAQVHSIPFYESLGYAIRSEEFDEEGIPHREMELPL